MASERQRQLRRTAAVDYQHLTRYERGIVASEKSHRPTNILRFARTADRV